MSRDATTAFARALVDEWVRAGTTDACVAPGSRSAPIALALAAEPRIRLHVHLDERSAAFFALGIGAVTGRPPIVLCTSGTAAANFHPAVLEAAHARVPMLVLTADRPPELRDAGAGQTIDQAKLYGDVVRWYHDPGVPEDRPGIGATWRALAARAFGECIGPPAGPVHLNLPFREPLVPTGAPLVEAPGRPGDVPWTVSAAARPAADDDTVRRLAAVVRHAPRGMLVCGGRCAVSASTADRFARAAGWPLVADAWSGVRAGGHAISTIEALVRAERFAKAHRPDVVIRVGAPPTSRTLLEWLDADVTQLAVDPERAWFDPLHVAAERIEADAESVLERVASELEREGRDDHTSEPAWLGDWLDAEQLARAAVDGVLDSFPDCFDGRVARDVAGAVPPSATLVVASSMPVRDLDFFAPPRSVDAPGRVIANRGVNGIDGLVSTALGVSAGSGAPVVALLGDLCFLHDVGGLLGANDRGLDVTFVVVDNDGGGIFSFLPQAQLPEHFETLFGTPHRIDLATVAAVHGIPVQAPVSPAEVGPAAARAIGRGGVQLVLVRTDRVANVAQHGEVWEAVARALG